MRTTIRTLAGLAGLALALLATVPPAAAHTPAIGPPLAVPRAAGKIAVGDPGGVILVQLPTPTTLRIEKQGTRGARCGSGPWTFSENATLYNR